jgi:hypothetical protein
MIIPDETYSTEGPQCPHCKVQITADADYYYDDNYTQDQCGYCGGLFSVEVYVSTSWTCTAKETP